MKESRTQRELLDLVRVIAEINDRFEGVREALRNGRFRFAAEDLTLLKKALHVDDDADVADQTENQPLVYSLLKKEWSDCFEEVPFFLPLGSVWLMRKFRKMVKKNSIHMYRLM